MGDSKSYIRMSLLACRPRASPVTMRILESLYYQCFIAVCIVLGLSS